MAVSAIKLQKHHDAQLYLTQRFVVTHSNFCVSLQKKLDDVFLVVANY